MNDSRERFEAWCQSESINASRLASGTYAYPTARVAWRGWQAAEKQALERAAEMFDALGKELAALQVRALIEQSASKEKQHG